LPADLKLVEPRLAALREPFRFVQTIHCLDGGTIGIDIVDAKGNREQFAIVCELGSDDCYERVFVGAYHHSQPGAAPVAHPAETKQQLIRILARYSGNDPYTDAALAKLRGWPTDWTRVWLHRRQGSYNYFDCSACVDRI
jgi:hypothetical protein